MIIVISTNAVVFSSKLPVCVYILKILVEKARSGIRSVTEYSDTINGTIFGASVREFSC